MTRGKRALKISPPVPRRMGTKDAKDSDGDSSIFYVKFRSESDRCEVEFRNEHHLLGLSLMWKIIKKS